MPGFVVIHCAADRKRIVGGYGCGLFGVGAAFSIWKSFLQPGLVGRRVVLAATTDRMWDVVRLVWQVGRLLETSIVLAVCITLFFGRLLGFLALALDMFVFAVR